MSDKTDVQQVYILQVQKLSDEIDFIAEPERHDRLGSGRPIRSRPQAIPFSTLERLKWHLSSLIMKGAHRLDPEYKMTIEMLWKDKSWDKLIEVWRTAQHRSFRGTGFDAFWEDEPQVVL